MQLKFKAVLTSGLGIAGSVNAVFLPRSADRVVYDEHRNHALGSPSPVTRPPFGLFRESVHSPLHREMVRAIRALPDDATPSGDADVARLDSLGSIGCINEFTGKVTPQVLDLLALYTGENIAFSMPVAPPNIFADFPKEITNIVHSRSTGALGASDTVIFPDCSDEKIMNDAPLLKKNGRVIISAADYASAIRKVALLQAIRPDLALYGHAPDALAESQTPTQATPVAASYAVADILAGGRAVVVRPLSDSDAVWLSELSGVSIRQGAAITANFNAEGTLDRAEWKAKFDAEPATAEELAQTAALNQRMMREMVGAIANARLEVDIKDQLGRIARIPGVVIDREVARAQIMSLGPTVIYGASGSIGNAISKALCANGVPVCCIVRNPTPTMLGEFAEMVAPKPIVSSTVPTSFVPSTAFLTASAGWPKDADGNIIFDRSKLLEANVNILAPIFKDLSPQTLRTVVISNPCSEMAYLGWLLRPDLADKIVAHAGTDVTRQRNRAPFPEESFTVGPHSPAQVNVKRNKRGDLELDRRIPTLGQQHQENSDDGNSVTVPTGIAAIWEGIRIANNQPQSLALPLSADEARTLAAFMTQHGQAIDVSEGIAITLPRDAQRQIRWDMLADAVAQIPAFSDKFRQALEAMEDGRAGLLQSVTETINRGRPEGAVIDRQWVLSNRGAVVSDALQASRQQNR